LNEVLNLPMMMLFSHQIQGESDITNPRNQQCDPKIQPQSGDEEQVENHQDDPSDSVTDQTEMNSQIQDQQQQILPIEEPETARSRRIRRPTQYVKELQGGIGTADHWPSKSNIPPGLQIPDPIVPVEGETEDIGQIEHAMAAAISEIKAIEPLSLEEAMGRPDHLKWELAIQPTYRKLELGLSLEDLKEKI
jgi:hypothetical protein